MNLSQSTREFNLGEASGDFENAVSGVFRDLNFDRIVADFNRKINQKMQELVTVERNFNSTLQKTTKIIADDGQKIHKKT